ncbi:MAG TPA: GspH/FimT family protein [Candidatus Paceibacterota bacterium]|nr:GspH/FimT family protein [Candidatus Paceibacterota bacterium]
MQSAVSRIFNPQRQETSDAHGKFEHPVESNSAIQQTANLRYEVADQGEEDRSVHYQSLIPTRRRLTAFTLIELILVLALLAIVTSFAAPSLSRFFRGRTLESEARQLLSLTHAAQSRAISDGFPVLLWIDTPQREYGLQLETASRNSNTQDTDPKAEQFAFADTLKIEAVNASATTLNGRSVSAIRFLPDGAADETSPTTVRLASRNGDVLWLIQATNRLSYEIRNSDK